MTKIEAPIICPSCSSVLESVNYLLYCRNVSCGVKVSKLVEHFASTLKIKGLGPAAVHKLDIHSLEEIYELTMEDMCDALGSVKLGEKLYKEVLNSRNAPLNVLLPAFSIPLIGKVASEKLSKVCNDIEEIDYDLCRTAGLGEKAATNLSKWMDEEFYQVSLLPFSFKFSKTSTTPVSKGIVCITGKLLSYKTKALAHDTLQKLGYGVKPSLTKDVTILINESGVESAKTKKARDSGVQIITNLLDLTGE
jgi:NAD-dependent DNA ligase